MTTLKSPSDIELRAAEIVQEAGDIHFRLDSNSARYTTDYMKDTNTRLQDAIGYMASALSELNFLLSFTKQRYNDHEWALKSAESEAVTVKEYSRMRNPRDREMCLVRICRVQHEELKVWKNLVVETRFAVERVSGLYDALKRNESGLRLHAKFIYGDDHPGAEGHAHGPRGNLKFSPTDDDERFDIT